ncbi:hypothetical protein B0H11DRAFT_1911561 [Mycena galericulata]|nr:hypothetical protein B0H11DRAFT_1911561 [Mycena galericulata]
MVDSKPRSFWHDHVRHLSILTSLEEDDVVKVLSTCSGVSNLALFQGDLRPAYLPLLAAMPLVRLATDLGAMFGSAQEIDFGHALFKNITHLDISDTLQHFYYFKEDPRAVLLPVNDYLRDWEIGAEGGTDYWVIAEDFVKKRHSGVIQASNFAIISSEDDNDR